MPRRPCIVFLLLGLLPLCISDTARDGALSARSLPMPEAGLLQLRASGMLASIRAISVEVGAQSKSVIGGVEGTDTQAGNAISVMDVPSVAGEDEDESARRAGNEGTAGGCGRICVTPEGCLKVAAYGVNPRDGRCGKPQFCSQHKLVNLRTRTPDHEPPTPHP